MKSLLFIALNIALLAISETTVAQRIQWQSDIETASQIATDENKLVLLHFEADWCRPCKTLETFVFSNPQVSGAMSKNVVPVKIDVDAQPNLVKEYGVSSVPFDVAMTPQGRVVSKRKSPRDASTYADMIRNFDNVIHCLNGDNPALQENLNQMDFTGKGKVIRNDSFTPDAPSHSLAAYSKGSFELKRKSRVSNPYAKMATSGPLRKSAPAVKQNQFVGVSSPATDSSVSSKTSASQPPMRLTGIKSADVDSQPAKNFPTSTVPSQNKTIRNAFAAVANDKSDDFAPEKKTRQKLAGKRSVDNADIANRPLSQTDDPIPTSVTTVTEKMDEQEFAPQTTQSSLAQSGSRDSTGFPFDSALDSATKRLVPDVAKETSTKPRFGGDFASVGRNSDIGRQPDIGSVQSDLTGTVATNDGPNARQGIATAATRSRKASAVTGLSPSVQNLLADNPSSNSEPVQMQGEAKIVMKNKFVKSNSRSSQPTTPNSPSAVTDGETPVKQPLVANESGGQPNTNATQSKPSESSHQFALNGNCPVELLKSGRWVAGDSKWGCIHRGKTYLFANEGNLTEFQLDPDSYSPLLAGYDPVVFHLQGELVEGNETHGVFMGRSPNLRIVLFSSAETRSKFQSNPKAYLQTIRQAMRSTGGSSSSLLR
jgi:YHS domain-containing protein/thiol-disulfide isomerase/thioredoxin